MASWQPNPIYGSPNGGDFIDDMGQVWPDPEGHLNTPTAAAPAGPQGGGPGVLAGNPLAMPVGAPTPPPLANNPLAMPAAADTPPDPEKILSVGKAAPPNPRDAHPPAPAPRPGNADAADNPPDPVAARAASPFVSVSEGKSSRAGLSDKDRATQEAAQGAAQSQSALANQSSKAAQVAQADLMRKRGDAAVQVGLQGEIDAGRKIEQQQRIAAEVDGRLNSDKIGGAAWSPDRTQIFQGGRGAAFGIAAAIAAMAGGWMMGRQNRATNAFLPSILQMIDDNVSDQVRKNSTMFQQLKEQKGSVGAAIAALKQQQLGYTQQKLNGIAMAQDSDIVRLQAQSAYDKLEAERAKANVEERQHLMQTVTTEHSSRMVANPAAAAQHLPRQLAVRHANNNQFIREWSGLRSELKGLEQSGDLNGYLGTFATHGANWVQSHLNGLPQGQQKAAIVMARLEELNHLHTGSTMVGLSAEEKERFGKVGVPEKVRDVSNTYQYFDQLARDKAEENKSFLGAAGSTDAEPDDSGPEASY